VEKLKKNELLLIMLAGSCAGAAEHGTMFPVDTIKTRMQTPIGFGGNHYSSISQAFKVIVQKEGFLRLYKGCSAILAAAIPSHALYFGVYESMRVVLNLKRSEHNFFKTMIAGAAATMAHDAFVTPLDVIKQRMQLKSSSYGNPVEAARCVCRESGWKAFVRSYPTTVLLNVPYMATQFAVYESSKLMLKENSLLANEESWQHHLVAGGIAGCIAGLISNPLDVIKTRIQTDPRCGFVKTRHIVQDIIQSDGYLGFLRGANARALYCMPSAALIWLTYDGLRLHFNIDIDEEYWA